MASLQESLGKLVGGLIGNNAPSDTDFRPPRSEPTVAPFGQPVPTEAPEEVVEEVREFVDVSKIPQEDFADDIQPFTLPDLGDDDVFDFGNDDDFDTTPLSELEASEIRRAEKDAQTLKQFEEGGIGAQSDPGTAWSDYFENLKRRENGENKGLTSGPQGQQVFMPIESLEGHGPDGEVFSTLEIGYGTKIPQSWLTDEQSEWPVIDGVPVDVRAGITVQQANSLARESLSKAEAFVKGKVKDYESLTSYEKLFWTDLVYNGGQKAIAKNPKAKKAMDKGFSGEAMIRVFDFIGTAGKKTRGLLNRRVSSYNKAAAETTGLPLVDTIEWGSQIRVRFTSNIHSDKVSDKFSKSINDNGGWYTVTTGPKGLEGKKIFQADKNYQF